MSVRLRRRPARLRALRADGPPARDPRPPRQALAPPGPRLDGCVIECELRLLSCPDCRVVTAEPVPWARPEAHHTRDFEDVVAWLAQQMAKTPIAGLLRIGWDSVGRIVERVVADHLNESRLSGLVAIGVDEISYCRGQRYLTSVIDHHTGAIVWCSAGRNTATLQAFFDEFGPERRHSNLGGLDRHERWLRTAG